MSVTLVPIPVTANLVTDARAAQNGTLAALQSSSPTLFASMLAAASDAVRQYCRRDLTRQAYSIYTDGQDNPGQEVILPQYPVASVDRVAADPRAVLTIINVSASAQRATVATTATGMALVAVASGVKTTSTLLYSDYPTLSALAAAIGGLGNGWAATATAANLLYASADLRPLQGAMTAKGSGGVQLEMFLEEMDGGAGAPYGWRLDAESGQLFGRFPRGARNVRVDYTAGYNPIPTPIQEAVVLHAQDMYQGELANNAIKSESLGPASYTLNSDKKHMSATVVGLLAPYRSYSALMIS